MMMPPKEKEKKEKYNKDNNSRSYTHSHTSSFITIKPLTWKTAEGSMESG